MRALSCVNVFFIFSSFFIIGLPHACEMEHYFTYSKLYDRNKSYYKLL